jgi:hypothetical protein
MAPADVVFDLASSCPRVAVDRAGRLFSVALNEAARDTGGPASGGAPELVIQTQGKTSPAWRRELTGRTLHFALADAHLGDGIAVAGAAIEPIRLLDETTRGRGMFVVSLAANGSTRFTRRIDALGGGDVPRVTAIVLGPRSEVTIAGTTSEPLDFGTASLARDEGAYDDTMMFVARYSPNGALIFSTARKARLGTTPRLVAWSDGTVAVAFDARDGKAALEWLDPLGHGASVSLALAGSIRAMAAAWRDDVVVATQRADETTHAPVIELARLTRRGETIWSRTMQGELQDGALAVRANGDTWFGGWLDGAPTACASSASTSDASGPLPRLQIVSADGRRCRSLPVATRDARWTTPASLVEGAKGRVFYATPYLGNVELPGVGSRSSGMTGSRCALFDLPADAPEYAP